MAYWQNRLNPLNIGSQQPQQQQQPPATQHQQQLLLQQQLVQQQQAAVVPPYAQLAAQAQAASQASVYNNATASLLAQFANQFPGANINQLTTAITANQQATPASIQQQQQQQTQPQGVPPPSQPSQTQQQAANVQQTLNYATWHTANRLAPQLMQTQPPQSQISLQAVTTQQQNSQPPQVSPLSINLNQAIQNQFHHQTSSQQQQQHRQETPQDPRLMNRNQQNKQQNQSGSNTAGGDVRPLMDLDTLKNQRAPQSQQQQQPSSSPNNKNITNGANYNQNRFQNSNNNNNNNSRFNSNSNGNRNDSGNRQSRFQPATTTPPPSSQLSASNGNNPNNTFQNRNLNVNKTPPATTTPSVPLRPSPSPSTASSTGTSGGGGGVKPLNQPSSSNTSSSTIIRQKSKSPTRRLSNSSHSTTNTLVTPATAAAAASNTSSNSSATTTKITTSKYSISLPKHSLNIKFNNLIDLKTQYPNLYIPSDFFTCKYSWLNSFRVDRPLKFANTCKFHVMRKECQSIFKNDAVFEPNDINHAWTVKVMLLAMPDLNDLYKRCCDLGDDDRWKDDRLDNPKKLIHFLVGTKGKHELMAIGGPWSPSLDGLNPESNPQTLINTAIRTTKALTGIDLSSCTQWFRMLELKYNRNEEYKTTIVVQQQPSQQQVNQNNDNTDSKLTSSPLLNSVSASSLSSISATEADSIQSSNFNVNLTLENEDDIETTIIFMPNVWSLMPNSIDYQHVVDTYKKLIDNPDLILAQQSSSSSTSNLVSKPPLYTTTTAHAPSNTNNNSSSTIQNTSVDESGNKSTQQTTNGQNDSSQKADSSQLSIHDEEEGDTIASLCKTNPEDVQNDEEEAKNEPTHYSKLDLKKMKVDELREELAARNLDTKGLKAQLITRLKDAIESERDIEEEKAKEKPQEEAKKVNEQVDKAEEMVVKVESEEFIQQPVTAEIPLQPPIAAATTSATPNQSDSTTTTTPNFPKLSKQEREKYYKLPSQPHIIVHPSNTAKNGKFDCQLLSLSTLLDYRKDDNKETTFEVSLFAECFHQMLIRDFGFNIYKSLLQYECEKEALKKVNSLKRKATTVTTTGTDDSNASETASENVATAAASKKIKQSTDDDVSTAVSTVSSTDTSSSTTEYGYAITKTKTRVINNHFVLSFTYLDTNRTGYIIEKELEDLLSIIGLSLNRSKIKSLLSKLSINKEKDKEILINYRQLTDKLTRDVDLLTNNNVKIAIPSDVELAANIVTFKEVEEVAKSVGSSTSTANGIIIEIDGTVVDVNNIIKKLEKSECTSQILESRLKDSNEQLNEVKSKLRNNERAKEKLYDEVQDLKRKLKEQQRLNKETDDKYCRFKDLMYRSKVQLSKMLDDYNDTIKRNQPKTSSSTTSSTSNDTNKSSDQTSSSSQQQQQQQSSSSSASTSTSQIPQTTSNESVSNETVKNDNQSTEQESKQHENEMETETSTTQDTI